MEPGDAVSFDVWCDLLRSLPRHHYPLWGQWLPEDGLLTFWEEECCGERLVHADACADTSVAARLEDHYGPPDRLSGSRLRSELRRNVGAALIRAPAAADQRLDYWLGDDEPSYVEVEALTSRWLRRHVCFRVVEWGDADMRRRWAQGMLAGSACRSGELPRRWLGRKAHDPRIAASGVWVPPSGEHARLTREEFEALAKAVERSLGLST